MDRYQIMKTVFQTLVLTGANHFLAPFTRGMGVIFTLHHVRPWQPLEFAPNRLLEITPEFLDLALHETRKAGFEIISLSQAVLRLKNGERSAKPFAVFTSDDGYKDNRDYAQPIFQKHQAPWTLFVTTGFADASSPLWWLDFQDAVRMQDTLSWSDDAGNHYTLPARTAQEKQSSANAMYWNLRAGSEQHLRETIGTMVERFNIPSLERTRDLCLSWQELQELAKDQFVSFGAHTLTHPMLAKQEHATAVNEIEKSREIIQRELQRPITHFAYPVGDPTSAGLREFQIARELGFDAAVTTRAGHIFGEHVQHLHALPRVSLNGLFQNKTALDGMLSGAPFMLWNKGKRLNVL